MTFEEFRKEASEKEAAFKAASEEVKRAGAALTQFYSDALGIDPNGSITIEGVSKLVGKIVDMKGGNA